MVSAVWDLVPGLSQAKGDATECLVFGVFQRHFIFASFSRMGKALAPWQVLDASGYSPEPLCLLVGQGQSWEKLPFCAEHPLFQSSVLF